MNKEEIVNKLENVVNNEKGEIKSWFNANKQRNILLIICIVLVGIIFLLKSCNNSLKNELNGSKQNEKALSDSIRVEKDKNGKIEYEKNILIADKKQLKDLNSDLYNSVKTEKGKVISLEKIIAGFKNEPKKPTTTVTTIAKYGKFNYGLNWCFDTTYNKDNSRVIEGETMVYVDSLIVIPGLTYLKKDNIKFNLITGIKENKDNLEIFVKSDYPGFYVSKLDGAIVDIKPLIKKYVKPKRFSIGPYIGAGINGNLKPSIQIGIGINYSLIQF